MLAGFWTTLNGTQEKDLYFRIFNSLWPFWWKRLDLDPRLLSYLTAFSACPRKKPTSWGKWVLSTGSSEGTSGRVQGAGFSHCFGLGTSQHWNQRDDCISEAVLIRCQLQWRHDSMGFHGSCLLAISSCIQACILLCILPPLKTS